MSPRRLAVVIVVTAGALLLTQLAGAAAPIVSITNGPSGVVASSSASFSFTVDDPLTIVECSVDGGGSSLCGSGFSVSGLGDGPHTFKVQATNVLLEPGSDSRSWTVDTSGPALSLSNVVVNVNGALSAAVTYSASGSDPNGPVSVSCSPLSGATFPLGTSTVSCTGTDGLGNTSSGSFTVTVRDVTPPTLTLPGTQTVNVNATSASVSYTVTAQDGSTPVTPSCAPPSGSSFPLGTTTVTCTATDSAGNTRSGTFSVVVQDATPPNVSITGGPTGTVGSTATITFTTNEGTLTCALDGGSFSACSSPASLTGLSSGSHTFQVRATDGAGNAATASRSWTVDATPPTFTAPPVAVEANGPAGAVVSFVVAAADDGVPLPPGAVSCDHSSGSLYPLGTRTVQCTATDSLGNVGTVTFPVTVRDTTPPTLIAADVTLTATSSAGIRRTDPALAAFLRSLRGTDLVSAVEITTNALDLFPIGKTNLRVRGVDGAGNASESTVTVSVLPPGQKAPPPPDLEPPRDVTLLRANAGDHSVTLTWVVPTVDDLAAIEVRMTSVGGTAAGRVVSRVVLPSVKVTGLKNGVEYRFVVSAIDKAGNASRGVVVLASPHATLLVLPKAGTKVRTPPLLRWAPVPSAGYYNVQLFRGKIKVLSAWPTRARTQLARTWMYDKAPRKLAPGTYTWYVWPGFGPRNAVTYGKLIGKSTFVVVAASDAL
jgi:HYR domain/Fibronectin type III domain